MEDLKNELTGDAMQANFSLWQSLITVNALLATLFIAIAAFKPDALSPLTSNIIFIGFITTGFTCVMLIANFLMARNLNTRYFKHKGDELKIDKLKQKEILSLYEDCKKIETISICVSLGSFMVMMWVVYILLFKV